MMSFDPHTACVGYVTGDASGEGPVDSGYYWYDESDWFSHEELQPLFPEISDAEWQRLWTAACVRGQAAAIRWENAYAKRFLEERGLTGEEARTEASLWWMFSYHYERFRRRHP